MPNPTADDPDDIETVPADLVEAPSEAPEAPIELRVAEEEEDEEIREAPPAEVRRRRAPPMTPGERSADAMLASSAAARKIGRDKLADGTLDEGVRRFMREDANGYFSVRRVGPQSMPESELGVLGDLSFMDFTGSETSPSAIVQSRWGGGSFLLIPKRSDGSSAEVDPVRLRVGGDPKPISKIGKKWLADAMRAGRTDEEMILRSEQPESSGQTFAMMLKILETQQEEARRREDREREERRREDERRRQEDERRREEDERRREEDRRREEERRKEEREERERERKAEERRWEQFKADQEARRKEEREAARREHESNLRMIEEQNALRMKRIEAEAEIASKRADAHLKLEVMRAENSATHGLGIEGLSKMQSQLGELMAKKVAKDLNLDDEKEGGGSIMDAMTDSAREVMPDLLRIAGETLLPRLANLIPQRGAETPPAAAPAAAPALPAPNSPRSLPAPDVVEPDALDPVPADAAGAPPAPPAPAIVPPLDREKRMQQARALAIQGVIGFARPLGVIGLARPDASAAWSHEISPNGRTLADAYDAMTEQARNTLAGADGWNAFTALLNRVSPEDATALTEIVAIEGGAEWVAEFLSAGPWHDESQEETAGNES